MCLSVLPVEMGEEKLAASPRALCLKSFPFASFEPPADPTCPGKLVFQETQVTIINWKGQRKGSSGFEIGPKWDKNTEGSLLESWAKLTMYLWGEQPLSSLPRLWKKRVMAALGVFVPQLLAIHGKPDLLFSKAMRETPISCLLWDVEVGALSACFASTGLLHSIGHIMPPIPGVLHGKGNCSLQLLPCPGEGCGQPITGHRMQRRCFLPLWSSVWLHGVMVLEYHAQDSVSTLIRPQAVGWWWEGLLAGSLWTLLALI